MSDISQGEGWWLASDDKWYPPQPTQPPTPESDKPLWRRIATRKVWLFPVWVYVLAALVVSAALGGGGSTDDQTAAEPAATVAPTAAPEPEPAATVAPTTAPEPEPAATAAPTVAPTAEPPATAVPTVAPTAEPTASVLTAFSDGAWETRLGPIIFGDDSLIAKGDAVVALAKEYSMTSTDIEEQIAYLVELVQTGSIVDRAEDKVFMFRLMFITRSLERAIDSLDDPNRSEEQSFAYDAYQIARDLAREVETPDSDFIKSNLAQLDDAITDIGPESAPSAKIEATIRCTINQVSADILTQGIASSCEEALARYRSLVPSTIAVPGSPAVDSEIILACYAFQADNEWTYETAEAGRMYDALHGLACDGDRSNLIPA